MLKHNNAVSQYAVHLVPASGVWMVICILNGPGPIAVDAATIQR